ncbi:MAG: DNA alkylation repair protein, partial [Blautia coccoides]
MTSNEILSGLKALSSEKYKVNVVKLGIPEACSIGVSTGDVRKLAKTVGKDNALAHDLWNTGYHEARLLAVLIVDKKQFSLQEAEAFMHDVISWDLCDHLCKNLLIQLKGYEDLIEKWCDAEATYMKRAAFTLMASAAIREKNLQMEALD